MQFYWVPNEDGLGSRNGVWYTCKSKQEGNEEGSAELDVELCAVVDPRWGGLRSADIESSPHIALAESTGERSRSNKNDKYDCSSLHKVHSLK